MNDSILHITIAYLGENKLISILIYMNLLLFFSLLVQYQVPVKFISDNAKDNIYDMLRQSNAIWQKFAQSLAHYYIQHESHKELGHMLEDFYCNCPRHDIKYSKSIIRSELSHMLDEDSMEFIASGTVSQTYKIRSKKNGDFVCVKIQHPNARNDINAACDIYDSVKDSYLFPSNLKVITWMFFDSLRKQCDCELEFNNSKQYSKSLKGLNFKHTETGRDIVITPEMIAFSNNCLVMEYLPSTNVNHKSIKANLDEIGNLNLARYLYASSGLILKCGLITQCIHQDLHLGNMGYIYDNVNDFIQIVVYDLGQYHYMDYDSILKAKEAKKVRKNAYYYYNNSKWREFISLCVNKDGLNYLESINLFDKSDDASLVKIVLIILENPHFLKHPDFKHTFVSSIKSPSANDLFIYVCNNYIGDYSTVDSNGMLKNIKEYHDFLFENHTLGLLSEYLNDTILYK